MDRNLLRALRVLIVEDSPADAELVLLELRRSGFAVDSKRVETGKEMAAALTDESWDLVVSDYTLPRFGAPEALELLRRTELDIPLIVVSGTIGEELAVETMRAGARDYILKNNLQRLGPAVDRELREAESRMKGRDAERAVHRLASIVESSDDAILSMTPEGTITSWNPAAERLYGRNAEEAIDRPIASIVPPDRIDELEQILARLRRGDVLKAFETMRLHKSGRGIDVSITLSAIRDAAGRLVSVSSVAHDISDRKQAETERNRLLERLRFQIERMPLGYMLTDPDFRIIDWNSAAEHIFGYKREEILHHGPPFEKILPPGAWPEGNAVLRRIRAGDMAAHAVNENLTKDGRTITCEWYNSPLFDREGTFLGLLSLAQDITARREAEASLQLRDRAIQAVTQGIIITDPTQADNPIIFASPSFLRLTGYPADEVVGRNCRFLQGKDTDGTAVARVRDAVREGQPCTVELLNYRKDGTSFWNELSISPVTDTAGHLTHFVGVQTDITQRRRLEDQYRQAQKMEAVGQLAAGVAHDFNNLLTVINGYSELLLQRLPADDSSRYSIGEIKKAGERSAGLTRQLLTFSRQQIVAPKILSLNSILTDLDKMLRRIIGEDVNLALSLSSNLGLVKADAGQIEQVIMNLAVNARDAMPQGGKLTIETLNAELEKSSVGLRSNVTPGAYVLLVVTDNGCGMSPETQEKIFEPFFTTKGLGQGTGLGLAVVHGIIQQSGGHIDVYSEAGTGTAFKIYLPSVQQPADVRQSSQGLSAPQRGTETILLAEDDDAVRDLTCRVLANFGYKIMQASDGEQALELAKEYARPIHLLITDVVMPRIGGRQVAERLVQIHPEAQVLYLSGYTDDAVVRHGILHEEVNFLQKPFSPLALLHKVRDVLREAKP